MAILLSFLKPIFGALFHEIFKMLSEPDTGEVGANNSGQLSGWVRKDDTHSSISGSRRNESW